MGRKTFRFVHATPSLPRAARKADDDYGKSDSPDWRQIDWPSRLRTLEVRGRPIQLVDIGGDGASGADTVLMIHGLSGCWQNWLENIPRVAQDRRVIAVDLPGFGRSEMPGEKISISGWADTLDELCERLGTGRVDVVGNSMGGFVGAELAIRHPERVDRLCLAAAAGIAISDLRRQPMLSAAKVLAWVGAQRATEQNPIPRRPGLRHIMFALVFRHPTRLAPELLFEQVQTADAPGFVDALDALTSYDFVERLPEIESPTLVVWGRNDPLVPVRDAYEYERLIPDARAVVLDDTGHVPMLERPRTFNELLLNFLAETGRADERSAAERSAEDELARSGGGDGRGTAGEADGASAGGGEAAFEPVGSAG